jgi:protein TonB
VKKLTLFASVVIHGGVALALLGAAQKRVVGKTVFVQMTENAKKKPKAVEKKVEKREPPKPRAQPVERKVALASAHSSAAPPPVARVAPIAAAIEMSNDEPIGEGDVVIPVARPAAAAPVKLASMEAERPRRRLHETSGPTHGPMPVDEACHEEASKPEPIYKTEIEYTAAARSEGIEGKLKLRITVGADGEVIKVDVLASVAPELDAAAVAAVRRWRFKPAMMCGKPVAGGVYIVARRFELGD